MAQACIGFSTTQRSLCPVSCPQQSIQLLQRSYISPFPSARLPRAQLIFLSKHTASYAPVRCSSNSRDDGESNRRRRPDYIPNRIDDPCYVRIFDTTLRDGEQSPGATMTSKVKLDVARQLAKLGVDIIEAGFPMASPDDLEAVQNIAKEVGNHVDNDGYVPVICGLARCNKADIDAAWEAVRYALRPRIHTSIATSDIHLKYKLKKSRDEVISIARDMVAFARSFGCNDVEFSLEDAGSWHSSGTKAEVVEEIETPLACARCYSLRHYGQVKDQRAENLLPDFDFESSVGSWLIKSSRNNRTMVVMVVDAVDFDDSFPQRAVKMMSEAIEAGKVFVT